jgi:hypothetical protein
MLLHCRPAASYALRAARNGIPLPERGLGVGIRCLLQGVHTGMKLYRYLPALVVLLGLIALLSACGGKGGGY